MNYIPTGPGHLRRSRLPRSLRSLLALSCTLPRRLLPAGRGGSGLAPPAPRGGMKRTCAWDINIPMLMRLPPKVVSMIVKVASETKTITSDELWWVHKALYGYHNSPMCWQFVTHGTEDGDESIPPRRRQEEESPPPPPPWREGNAPETPPWKRPRQNRAQSRTGAPKA